MSERPTTKHDIQRDELNITRPGFDVVTNIIVSGSISMLSTGVDAGTGQVSLIYYGRETIISNRTYYVRTDGNDSNTGLVNTAGGAFLTIQKAIDVTATLDLSIYNVTIQVADGTYTGAVVATNAFIGAGTVTIQGNSGTPANVVISVTSNSAFTAQDGASLIVKDLKILTTTSGYGLLAQRKGSIQFGNLNFGACADRQLRAMDNGAITCISNYTISGGAPLHMSATTASVIRVTAFTITLSGTPAFSTAFVQAINGASVQGFSNTFSGSATGPRYEVQSNGVVNSAGGGANYFPGNSAGSATTGGQYL